MTTSREESEQRTAPLSSMTGDRKRLTASAAASAEELRDFIAGLRGRSPQEVLGELSSSSLMQGIVQASIGCVVLVIVFTLIPFWMGGSDTAPASAAAAPVDTATPDDRESTVENSTQTDASADLDRATEVMGLDETRTAAPDVNPRESELDSLLDGIE